MAKQASRFGIAAATLAVSAALLIGQSGRRNESYRVGGIVNSLGTGFPVASVDLTFRNQTNQAKQATRSDSNGRYQINLPPGLYTMKASLAMRGSVTEYDRPLFRISSALTLNVELPPQMDCDPALPSSRVPSLKDDVVWSCGTGKDSFPMPEGSTPFELVIQYDRRTKTQQGFVYENYRYPPSFSFSPPVEIFYNLFTLYASTVTYNPTDNTIDASGSVIAEWADGPTKRADSMRIKISSGQASIIQ